MSAVKKLQSEPASSSASDERLSIQSLQASQEVILQLERSKASTDAVLDGLPEIFLIVEASGTIRRCNEGVAALLGVDIETALGMSCVKLFSAEAAHIFAAKVASVVAGGEATGQAAFELPVAPDGGKAREVHWTIKPFVPKGRARAPLYCVLGRDVSQMRAYERQVGNIFSNIPLGILCINGEGKVEQPYSVYAEHLLGRSSLEGQHLDDLLFAPGWDSLTRAEKEGAKQVLTSLGEDDLWFGSLKSIFPSEILHPGAPGSGAPPRWLGVSYFPVIKNDQVAQLLIVLEDRTQIVQARIADDRKRRAEGHVLERLNEIQACDPAVLRPCYEDLDELFARIDGETGAGDYTAVKATLHGIKGVARTAGLTHLKTLAHELEDAVLHMLKAGQTLSESLIVKQISALSVEWRNVAVLAQAALGGDVGRTGRETAERARRMQAQRAELKRLLAAAFGAAAGAPGVAALSTAIDNLGRAPLAALDERLRKLTADTAAALGKAVRSVFDWGGAHVDEGCLSGLAEILTHMVNNAVDHGIAGSGTLRITARQQASGVTLTVADDGRGVCPEKVKASAIAKGVVTEAAVARLTDAAAQRLIFEPGFSTAEVVSDISGRGIGLDAVQRAVQRLGGDGIELDSAPGRGTVLTFKIPSGDPGV